MADYAGVPASMLGAFFDNMMANVEAQLQQPLWMQLGDVGMYEAIQQGRVTADDFVQFIERRHKEKKQAEEEIARAMQSHMNPTRGR